MSGGPTGAGDELLHAALVRLTQRFFALEDPARSAEEDAVHQLRVATTRLRALLHVYGRALTPTPQAQLGEELRWFAGLLGAERDAEVRAEVLGRLIRATPQALSGSAGEALVGSAVAERASAHGSLRCGLESERYRVLATLLGKFAEHPPFAGGERTRGWYRRNLDRAVGEVLQRHAKLARVESLGYDAALHRVRTATKRARYAAEVLSEGGSRHAKRVATQLHRVQEVLGAHHDASELCRRFVATAARGEGGLLSGWLYREEHEAMARAERDFDELWTRVARSIS